MNFEIDKLIKMGKSHTLHCEDDFYIKETDDFIVCAVFDGCSSGIDSHYASTRHKYFLNDVIKHYIWTWKSSIPIESSLRYCMYGLYVNLYNDRSNYKVNEEMLSTVVLCFINKQTNEYGIIFCGDGCCSINNENISIHDPNGNAVWYLSSIVNEEISIFDEYFSKCKIYSGYIENNSELCISTDGIESFMTKYGRHNEEYPKKVFFNTKMLPDKYHKWNMERLYNVMIKGKLPELNDEGISNIDDLTIIKIKCNEII